MFLKFSNQQQQQILSADALRAAMAGISSQPQQVQRPPVTNLNRVLSPDAIIATGILDDPEGKIVH